MNLECQFTKIFFLLNPTVIFFLPEKKKEKKLKEQKRGKKINFFTSFIFFRLGSSSTFSRKYHRLKNHTKSIHLNKNKNCRHSRTDFHFFNNYIFIPILFSKEYNFWGRSKLMDFNFQLIMDRTFAYESQKSSYDLA